MSNALAIASVTAVLKDLLNNGVIDHDVDGAVGEFTVTALPPDRALVEGQQETNRINLFMYQVTPNQGWRNGSLPSRDSSGNGVSNPPLGLDLHYLISTYGAGEFHAEILLGYALQLLHETPILTRDAIRRSLAAESPVTGTVLPPPLDVLIASELAEQVEQIRLTPENMSIEECSKLWTAFQAHYRPTAVYRASVVLIESRRRTRPTLPVANDKRRIYVVPFRFPTIDAVASAEGERAPVVAGTTLEIRGHELRGDRTFVHLHGLEFVPPAESMTAEHIRMVLPDPLPAGLYAGVKGVQIVHRLRMGDPETDHRGFESNVAAFVLRPRIENGPAIDPGDVLDLVETEEEIEGTMVPFRAGRLRIRFEPRVARGQRVAVLLNETGAAAGAETHAYVFPAPAGNGLDANVVDTRTMDVPFSRVVAGTYLVRVRVDGAESVLDQDGDGRYAWPRVVLP